MNVVWIILGLGVLAAVVALIGWSQRSGPEADLGVVSHQWLAEHRHSQSQDSHR